MFSIFGVQCNYCLLFQPLKFSHFTLHINNLCCTCKSNRYKLLYLFNYMNKTSNEKVFSKKKGQKQVYDLQCNALTLCTSLVHFAVQLHKVE